MAAKGGTRIMFFNGFLLALFVCECAGLTPQCKDEYGEPVDWFFVFKLARDKKHLNPLVRRGEAYLYLTPAKLKLGWIMSDLAISDPKSMIGRTLAPLYQDKNIISVVYNDQPPAGEHQPDTIPPIVDMYYKNKLRQMQRSGFKKFKKFKYGDKFYDDYDLAEMCKMYNKVAKTRPVKSKHTKGVLLGDKSHSLWLVHSVPRFPPIPDSIPALNVVSYNYPSTSLTFGQSFLCATLPSTSILDMIAVRLKYSEPLVVYSHIPQEFEEELPNVVDLVQK